MRNSIPQIRFKYGWLVAGEASHTLNEAWGDGTPLREYDEYEAIARKYHDWWVLVGPQLVAAMAKTMELEFAQSTIDVYVVPWFNAISDPLIIGPAFQSPDEIIVTVTHELLHRLLTENTKTDYTYDYLSGWRELYGDHDMNVLIHIPVHAIMKKLFTEDLQRSELVELDKQLVKDNQDYVDAWAYVEEHGYEQIIQKLVDWYKNIC